MLVIGCGSIGERHTKNLLSLGIREITVYDKEPRRMEHIKKTYGVNTEKDLNAALDEKPDAVLVCTPPTSHIPIASMAVEAGGNVFIEKPLSHSMAGIEDLIRKIKRKGVLAVVGYNFRFHPGLRLVKRFIENHKIGRVMWGRAQVGQYLPDWRPTQDYRMSYTAKKEMGGGIILDGSHEIDYMRWLLGDVKEVTCFAAKVSSLEVNVEDTADILMKHTERALSNIHMDFIRRDYSRVCEIVGEEGTIVWSFPTGKVKFFHARNKKWRTIYRGCGQNKMYLDEIRHFIMCVKGKEEPVVDIEEGKKTLEVALAAKKSAEKGKAIIPRGARK